MAKTATVRARIEPVIKKEAENVLRRIGMSPSDAINVFYRRVARGKGIPFSLNVPTAETRKAITNAHKGKGLRMTSDAFAREVRTMAKRA